MSKTDEKFLRILYLGPQAHGSNAGALAKALRRAGNVVQAVNPEIFWPKWSHSLVARVVTKAIRGLGTRELNKRIIQESETLRPDVFFVFKGPALQPETLIKVKKAGAYAVLFFPDVSFYAHGELIPRCLPHYDYIFTTKTFGLDDLKKIGITAAEFLPHGFDPDLHRQFDGTAETLAHLRCDASFIGTWSPKKEAILARLKELLPKLRLKIWGGQWEKARAPILETSIVGISVEGDAYPSAIQASTVNIAILSEVRQGASRGDQITSRTFHIPASGGFMLHERTDEFLQLFREGEEVACFETGEELAEKIAYYLDHPVEREEIRQRGYARCVAEHSLDARARYIQTRVFELLQRSR